jgi:hypothetical protein
MCGGRLMKPRSSEYFWPALIPQVTKDLRGLWPDPGKKREIIGKTWLFEN